MTSTIPPTTSSSEDLDVHPIINDEADWAFTPKFCDFSTVIADLTLRQITEIPKVCISYQCPTHAPDKVARFLEFWQAKLPEEPFWVALLPKTEVEEEERIRKRLNENARRLKAQKITIVRLDSTRWVFATKNIGGRSVEMHLVGSSGDDAWPLAPILGTMSVS